MRVTIFPGSKTVRIDNVRKKLMTFDWAPYAHIHAIQVYDHRDFAEVEFVEVDPDGDGPLPPVKPPNECMTRAQFLEKFAPILAAWDAEPEPPVRAQPASQQPAPRGPNPLEARLAALETKFAILLEEVSKARSPDA